MKSYISVILISALLLATLFFALPKTEQFLPFNNNRFDLNKKEETYWKKEFIVELKLNPKDRATKEEFVETSKDIIYKRLKKFGVEEVQIVNHPFESEDDEAFIKEYLKITIQTTLDENIATRLISSTGDVKIMTPKEDWEKDEENLLDAYMQENYDSTKWNRNEFRNILINDLRTSDGSKSYFGIFKPSFGNKGEFRQFIEGQQGQTIGILMDSFVIPIQVSPDDSSMFAFGIGPDKGEAHLQNILLNTGVLPVSEIQIVSTENLDLEIYKIDHIQISLAILLSTISILGFLYNKEKENKEKILQMGLSLLLIFSLSLTILKIWQIPVDLFLLIPTGILAIIFVKTMYTCTSESKTILILTILVSVLMTTLGTGYIPILGRFLLFIVLLSFVAEILTNTYFKNIKEINGRI